MYIISILTVIDSEDTMNHFVKLNFSGSFSYNWHKNENSIYLIKAVKSFFSGLKAIFCGYLVNIYDPETRNLYRSHPDARFSSEIDRILGWNNITVGVVPPSVFGAGNKVNTQESAVPANPSNVTTLNKTETQRNNEVGTKEDTVSVKPPNATILDKKEKRRSKKKVYMQEDLVLPEFPNVTTLDEAKKVLAEELNKQKASIEQLQIDEKYEHLKQHEYTREESVIPGSRRKDFQRDLDLQYKLIIEKLDQCCSPEEINDSLHDSVYQMQRLGIYRYWCLRQPAPENPLPYYKGRVSFNNRDRGSCSVHGVILLLLHSGVMNYFIFRPLPIEKKPAEVRAEHIKNMHEHQNEWQRLYTEILYGSEKGGKIDVPYWFTDNFRKDPMCNQADGYEGIFIDQRIVFKPKEILRRLETPNANTAQKLKERILSDWRACRLHTGRHHYITLIRDKKGKITSIDNGRLGDRTLKNSQALLDKFLTGKPPYEQPSYIDFWE